MVAYNFFDLVHKNARFWSFLANFWFKINSRGATTIRQCRVIMRLQVQTHTLRYLINVALRLFILGQKLAKNDQNLAFLCNKVKNLQATTHLFDALRLFDT